MICDVGCLYNLNGSMPGAGKISTICCFVSIVHFNCTIWLGLSAFPQAVTDREIIRDVVSGLLTIDKSAITWSLDERIHYRN